MDDVNSIAQWSITPVESFIYNFKVIRYGTFWYQIHYKLQYSEGVLGFLITHPSLVDYDEAKHLATMSKWPHIPVFMRWVREVERFKNVRCGQIQLHLACQSGCYAKVVRENCLIFV
jgi:hypothetical protein